LKSILSIFFATLLFFSFQGNAQVVTSKSQAIKKRIYELPEDKSADSNKSKSQKRSGKNQEKALAKANKKSKIAQLIDTNEPDIIIDEGDFNYFGNQLVYNAADNLGSPYRGGGMSKAGFDCSGLVYTTFKNFEIMLPRSSNSMANYGYKVDRVEAKPGDLIFFRTNGKRVINHVGLVTEVFEDEIKFIHSSTSAGVIISSTKENYYSKTFAQVNRVVEQ
jgi:cell wall-associated NlpC family hydrolase